MIWIHPSSPCIFSLSATSIYGHYSALACAYFASWSPARPRRPSSLLKCHVLVARRELHSPASFDFIALTAVSLAFAGHDHTSMLCGVCGECVETALPASMKCVLIMRLCLAVVTYACLLAHLPVKCLFSPAGICVFRLNDQNQCCSSIFQRAMYLTQFFCDPSDSVAVWMSILCSGRVRVEGGFLWHHAVPHQCVCVVCLSYLCCDPPVWSLIRLSCLCYL